MLCAPFCYFFFNFHSKQRHTINLPRRINDNEYTQNRQTLQFYQRNRSTFGYAFGKSNDEERRRKDSTGNSPNSAALERALCPDEARVMQRANQIVQYVPPKAIRDFIYRWRWSFLFIALKNYSQSVVVD